MRILYVVNGFDPGGAEHGFLTLVENGAFEDHDLRVLALCRGRGDLADEIGARLGKRVQFVTHRRDVDAVGVLGRLFQHSAHCIRVSAAEDGALLEAGECRGSLGGDVDAASELRCLRARGGIPSPPVPGALRAAPASALEARRRSLGRLRGDARRNTPLFRTARPSTTRDPPLRRGESSAVQDRLCIGTSPSARCCREAHRAQERTADAGRRRWPASGRRRCDARRLRRGPREAGH